MNFRPDRAREITRCFVDADFTDVDEERASASLPLLHHWRNHARRGWPSSHRELTTPLAVYLPGGASPRASPKSRGTPM